MKKYSTVTLTLISAWHGFLYFFSDFPYWFVSMSFFISLSLIVCGAVIYQNPTHDDFQELSTKPENIYKNIFKTSCLSWLIIKLTIMHVLA